MRVKKLLTLVALVCAFPAIAWTQGADAGIAATVAALSSLKGNRPGSAIALRIAPDSVIPRAVSMGAARALGFTPLEMGGRTNTPSVVYEMTSATIGSDTATYRIQRISGHGVAVFHVRVTRDGSKWIVKERTAISIS